MSEHSTLSPSSMSRWSRCPGSVALCAGIPRSATKYSAWGSVAHIIAADCLVQKRNPGAFLGRIYVQDGFEIAVNQEMVDTVQAYAEVVRPRFAGADLVLIEEKLDLSSVYAQPDQLGTGDCIILRGHGLEIHDLKGGKGVPVSAEGNEQMLSYAAGALEAVERVVGAGTIKDIEMWIHQPRVRSEPDTFTVSRAELMVFVDAARRAARIAMQPNQPLVPGVKQCRFCSAKATCPALGKEVLTTVADKFDNIETPKPVTSDTNALGALFAKIPLIELWCRAVIGRVEELAFAGTPVPGVKVVQGKQGNRAWGDADKVRELVADREQMFERVLLSPPAAEKVLKKADKALWATLCEHVVRSDGKLQVVSVDDARPAVSVEPAANKFEALS